MANRSFVRRAGPKRAAAWSPVITSLVGQGVTTKSTGNLFATGVEFDETVTLIRSRGMFMAQFDAAAINDVVEVGIGMGVYSADAFAIGQTAMPGPLTDPDWDWVWYKTFVFGPALTATQSELGIPQNLWGEIDSKAMRKLKSNQVVGWMVERVVLAGAGTIDIGLSCRHLLKLA